ncbi:MAG TPA: hypothetical protein VGF14_01125 [Alphaproteobacteria bacterium]
MTTETIIPFETIEALREKVLPDSDYPPERDLSQKDSPLIVEAICNKFFINKDEIANYKNMLSFFLTEHEQDMLLLVTQDERNDTILSLFSLQEHQALRIGTNLKGHYSEPYIAPLNHHKQYALKMVLRGDFINNAIPSQNNIHRIRLSPETARDFAW